MQNDLPTDPTLEEHAKRYFRGLIKRGLSMNQIVTLSGQSRATIYRKYKQWGWVRGWIELDPSDRARPGRREGRSRSSPPAAPPARKSPTRSSPPAPPPKNNLSTSPPGSLLAPEIRARMEILRKRREQP